MNIYIDCEFNQFGGQLISLALAADDGTNFYAALEITEEIKPWVSEHVIPLIDIPYLKLPEFQSRLESYLTQFDRVHIIADWPDDISYFCKSLITSDKGTRINTPPLTMEVLRIDAPSKIPHNALADAEGLREWFIGKEPEEQGK